MICFAIAAKQCACVSMWMYVCVCVYVCVFYVQQEPLRLDMLLANDLLSDIACHRSLSTHTHHRKGSRSVSLLAFALCRISQ